VILLEAVGAVGYDLVNIKTHISFGKTPEHLQSLFGELVFLQKNLDNLITSLHNLKMCPSWIKNEFKDFVIDKPLDDLLGC
jgi:hypothetical protein